MKKGMFTRRTKAEMAQQKLTNAEVVRKVDEAYDSAADLMQEWDEPDGFLRNLNNTCGEMAGLGQNYGGFPAAVDIKKCVQQVKDALPQKNWNAILEAFKWDVELASRRFPRLTYGDLVLLIACAWTSRWTSHNMHPCFFIYAAVALFEADRAGHDVYGTTLAGIELAPPKPKTESVDGNRLLSALIGALAERNGNA